MIYKRVIVNKFVLCVFFLGFSFGLFVLHTENKKIKVENNIELIQTIQTSFSIRQEKLNLINNNEVEEDLEENINNQLNGLDFSGFDEIINNLDSSSKELLNNSSFLDIVKHFINGESTNVFSNFPSYLANIIFSDILLYVPYFAIIIIIAIIYSLIGQFSTSSNKGIEGVVHIACFNLIAVIILKIVSSVVTEVSSVIGSIETQMELIFPIILTLMTAIGSVVTVATFQPVLAVLSAGITKIFTMLLIPIFIFSVVFSIVGNISKTIRMEKFSKFFSSLFNWIVGIVFTIFIAFLTIHGLSASSVDTISFRTAKFAIKSYLPLGSYLSDGIGLIMASSVLIKNAVGVAGLVLLFVTIFSPIIKLAVLMLLLKFVSSIIETLSNNQISNFLYGVSKSLNMLNICLIAIGFMFLISVSMLMCCSNII